MIRAFWYKSRNVGDTLTPIIVKYFTGQDVVFAERGERGKLLAIGSVMSALRNGDLVWGTGVMRETDKFLNKEKCKFLAVRGKLTEKKIGREIGVYGDPALLLPLMYKPKIEVKHEVGYIPHCIDKITKVEGKYIDIEQDWKKVINDILSCKRIISSSLHGIVIAEAYGVPAEWIMGSEKILGKGFKFRDYLTGTGRKEQGPGQFPKIENLEKIQYNLIKVLKNHYGIPMD